jgi:predicted alpha-1,2-mannosidase
MWIGHWDPASRFLRGKNSDGTWWSETIDPVAFTDEFVEGNAWQYLWEVPFDVPELARQFGGKEALLGKLDTFFDLSQKNPAPTVIQEGNFKGPDDYYWHGNEPDIHAPYLYALAGEPDRGARWIDWVRRTKYDDTPDGLAGNDDAGTLSAWYVFSALGFYPLAGSDVYVIGTPLFDRATLHLAGGDLVIIREGEGLFIRSATFGGRTLSSPILRHGDLARGGELRFVMSTELAGWGRGEAFGQEDPGR